MSAPVVDTITVGTNLVTIYADDDSPNPRDDHDQTCVLVLDHGRHNLPKEENIDLDAHSSWEEVADVIRARFDVVAMLPVYGIDHGQLALRAGEPYADKWDSGQAGLAYVTREAMATAWAGGEWTEVQAHAVIAGEVEEFNDWLTSDVYGYVVTDADGVELDSCWGMYGLDYCKAQAVAAAEQADPLPGFLLKGSHRVLSVTAHDFKPGDVTIRAGVRVLVCAVRTITTTATYTTWEVKDPATGLSHEHEFLDDRVATFTILRPE